jgi:pyruvate-ferredoxin/flavodoxin oxidoreductase
MSIATENARKEAPGRRAGKRGIPMKREIMCIDGNEAAAHVAYRVSEVIAIYPITPSSAMGELADQWSSAGVKNLWGTVPRVVEMQSEGGAAGAVHGALQAGALCTTFTASQGLLLMIPNMFKIAGELTAAVFHIAARSIAAQALSIFGDHSDVMATRSTGWGMLFSNSPQEVMDLALVAHAAALEARVPFLHVFDGFRTSHEIQRVEMLNDEDIHALVSDENVRAHRDRGLTPDRPVMRGTAQNPDTYFQARETVNPFYLAAPEIVQRKMDELGERTGRRYGLYEYVGAEDAERVIVAMGSGCEAVDETVRHLTAKGEKVGAVKVRMFRPFSVRHFVEALPETVRAIAALDRTKEPGGAGEPLYQDVMTAVGEAAAADAPRFAAMPRVVGGRYGLSSKEFTPAMVKGIFDEMAKKSPKNHFTVGIVDDVTHTSIDYAPSFTTEGEKVKRAMFWGLGSDGTVGANKNSIKIIGDETGHYTQAYFVYDSKKSGARTVSHLRFGPEPIRSTYLIDKANFVAVHQFGFLDRFDTLSSAEPGAVFLLNAPFAPDEVWDQLPPRVRDQIVAKKLKFYCIDAYKIAREHKLGVRINTIMQTAFFAVSGLMSPESAAERIKDSIHKTYGKRGEVIVRMNCAAVDDALGAVHEVKVPKVATGAATTGPAGMGAEAPAFVRDVTYRMMIGDGDSLPVSAFPPDGTYPTGTTRYEKRNIALEVPVWETDICIQCGKCVMVCPHAVIRSKVVGAADLAGAPEGFKAARARWRDIGEQQFTLQVAVEDCTGCHLCAEICPAKDKSAVGRKALNMVARESEGEQAIAMWDFFEKLPEPFERIGGGAFSLAKVKDVQLLSPLFEFSSACAGCGETPYLKLMSQLFGDRALIANATGCSSIYGGNMPTTPWTVNRHGRGPAWSNSLFEDNAEFGLGMRLALDKQGEFARELLVRLRDELGGELVDGLLGAEQGDQAGIEAQRERVAALEEKLARRKDPASVDLRGLAGALVRKSVWIVGGDGWAYDIGFGGVDHVLASGRDVNLLVLDTEVYSNTGGQASKATPLGAVAKFAAGGKAVPKKDLGMIAMSYGHVYVAQVAMGADDTQTLRAFREAEAHPGPSLIIAYSHCIAHGIDMTQGMRQQKLAAETGHWPLYRFDPAPGDGGKRLHIDSKPPTLPLKEYVYNENRYRMLVQSNPAAAERLLQAAQKHVNEHWKQLEELATLESPQEK